MQAALRTTPVSPLPEQPPVPVNVTSKESKSAVSVSCSFPLIFCAAISSTMQLHHIVFDSMHTCCLMTHTFVVAPRTHNSGAACSGSGITPFTAQKQPQLINVFVDATSVNPTAPQFSVLLVSSAFSSRHRSLLQNPIIVRCLPISRLSP